MLKVGIAMGFKWEFFNLTDIVSWVLAVISIGTGVFFGVSGYDAKFAGVVLACQICLLFVWGKVIYARYTYEKIIKDKNSEISSLNSKIELLNDIVGGKDSEKNSELEKLEAYYKNKMDEWNDNNRKIIVSIKNLAKLNNDFSSKIQVKTDSSYRILEMANNGRLPQEINEDDVRKTCAELEEGFFSLYKRYSSNLIVEAMRLQNTYLKMKGIDLPISMTVKLFDKFYQNDSTDFESIKVYTAFRDKETFENGEREIGRRSYKINLNTDFMQCLNCDHFIINNIKPDSCHYINEHAEYRQYYNCTVVVPIFFNMSNDTVKYYGYLCCECLNNDEQEEVFDKNSANYLFVFAKIYASYIATMEANWNDRICFYKDFDKEYDKDFLGVISSRTLKV